MKKLFFILVSLLIFSCSSKVIQPTTATMVEDYVKSQMKDPSSFQLIKNELVDTVMMSKWINDQYNKDTAMVSETILKNKIEVLKQNFASDEKAEKEKLEKTLDGMTEIYRKSATK